MESISYMFPRGLRVLAVDESFVCLKTIETLLKECRYQVTTATSAEYAVDLLRKNKEYFDIVITDIETGEMNGFRLSEIICLEMDLPVLMMCKGNDRETLMKCMDHGACGCLMKPPIPKEIQNIWQYAFKHKKKKSTLSERNLNRNEEASGHTTRISWKDPELHAKFVKAYTKLGDEATPSKMILEMNVPGLTRPQVASHLQNYRNIANTAFYGMSGYLPSSTFPTLEKLQYINGIKKYLSGLKSHRRGKNQLSHHGETRNISNHSFLNQNHQSIQFPTSTVQNFHNQTYASRLNTQSFSSSSNLLDPYTVVAPADGPSATNVMQSQRVNQISWLGNSQVFQETDNVNHDLGSSRW